MDAHKFKATIPQLKRRCAASPGSQQRSATAQVNKAYAQFKEQEGNLECLLKAMGEGVRLRSSVLHDASIRLSPRARTILESIFAVAPDGDDPLDQYFGVAGAPPQQAELSDGEAESEAGTTNTSGALDEEAAAEEADRRAAEQELMSEFVNSAGSASTATTGPSGATGETVPGTRQDRQDEGWTVVKGNVRKKLRQLLSQAPLGEAEFAELCAESAPALRQRLRSMTVKERWTLHNRLVLEVRAGMIPDLVAALREYGMAKRVLEAASAASRGQLLRHADVVAMTTTFAARNCSMLEVLGADTVVVEEAAEVLESHVLALMSRSVQRMLLIGDHQQLQPSTTSHMVGTRMRLGISLFERLVLREYRCSQLTVQRRMRPPLADIFRGEYRRLCDHPDTANLPPVEGLKDSQFLWDHDHQEKVAAGLHSPQNEGEARLVLCLARYLLLQRHSYTSGDLVILTPYVGQLLLLRAFAKVPSVQVGVRSLADVRIRTVDMFQGDEANVVLLSLVRSHTPGFLRVRNRVLVALSRARSGMYVFGNATLISRMGGLWSVALEQLPLRTSARLACLRRGDTREVATVEEMVTAAPGGGCKRPCGQRLECGHPCDRLCHPEVHNALDCTRPCARGPLPCGHQCHLRCNTPCKCTTRVNSNLPCGHSKRLLCGVDPGTVQCDTRVPTSLSCGHTLTVRCHEAAQVTDDACVEVCGRMLDCGHTCAGRCNACRVTGLHGGCTHECERVLICGHVCGQECSMECPPCDKMCPRECPHSRCGKKCGVPCTPCTEPCTCECPHRRCTRRCGEECDCGPCNEPCPRTLRCGHPCIGLCGEPCPPKCRVCNEGEVTCIIFGSEDEPGARFVHLGGCDHIVEVSAMDQWVEELLGEQSGGAVRTIVCPLCRAPVRGICPRYHARMMRVEATIDAIRQRIANEHARVAETMHEVAAWASQPPATLREELARVCPPNILDQAFRSFRETARRVHNVTEVRSHPVAEEAAAAANLRAVAAVAATAAAATAEATSAAKVQALRSLDALGAEMLEWSADSARVTSLVEVRIHHRRASADSFRMGRILLSLAALRSLAASQVATGAPLESNVLLRLRDATRRAQRLREAMLRHTASSEHNGGTGASGASGGGGAQAGAASPPERVRAMSAAMLRRNPLESDEIESLQRALDGMWQRFRGVPMEFVRRVIAPAMNQQAGHWYKCPNGHLYVIGECGGAMQEGRCPDCGATVGGTSHRLRGDNNVAADLYDSRRYEWMGPRR